MRIHLYGCLLTIAGASPSGSLEPNPNNSGAIEAPRTNQTAGSPLVVGIPHRRSFEVPLAVRNAGSQPSQAAIMPPLYLPAERVCSGGDRSSFANGGSVGGWAKLGHSLFAVSGYTGPNWSAAASYSVACFSGSTRWRHTLVRGSTDSERQREASRGVPREGAMTFRDLAGMIAG